jgi:hypothetical protein
MTLRKDANPLQFPCYDQINAHTQPVTGRDSGEWYSTKGFKRYDHKVARFVFSCTCIARQWNWMLISGGSYRQRGCLNILFFNKRTSIDEFRWMFYVSFIPPLFRFTLCSSVTVLTRLFSDRYYQVVLLDVEHCLGARLAKPVGQRGRFFCLLLLFSDDCSRIQLRSAVFL